MLRRVPMNQVATQLWPWNCWIRLDTAVNRRVLESVATSGHYCNINANTKAEIYMPALEIVNQARRQLLPAVGRLGYRPDGFGPNASASTGWIYFSVCIEGRETVCTIMPGFRTPLCV